MVVMAIARMLDRVLAGTMCTPLPKPPAALVLDRKKLAAFSAAAGRFLQFPIGDRRGTRMRASASERPVTRAQALQTRANSSGVAPASTQAAYRALLEKGLAAARRLIVAASIYLESLPIFTRGLVRLPNHARLIRELCLLERRTQRSGKDTVEHPRNGHDDFANVVCGVLS